MSPIVWTVVILFQLFHSTAGYRNDGPPSLLVRPESKTVPVDTTLVLFCRAGGEPLPNIMWLSNGHIITDSRYKIKTLPDALSILRIEPIKLADANQTLSCTAENGIGSPVKAEAIINILNKDDMPIGFPVIEAHPVMKSVESGRTAHLSCRVKGEPTPKVLWLKNSIPVDVREASRYSVSTMGNPGALMIQKATEEDQGKFECVASNHHGVVHSKAVHLFVKERQIPPYFSVKLPPVHKVPTGGTVNLTCVAVGYPMPRVFWRRQSDGLILNDPSTAPIGRNILTVRDVRKSETYKCLAVSKLGNIGAITVIEPDGPYIPVPSPKNVRVTDVNASSVSLRWDPLSTEERLMKMIVKFRIKHSDGLDTEMDFYDVDSNNQLTVNHLQNFQHYEFTLIAETASGKRSPSSLPIEAHTVEATTQPPVDIQFKPLMHEDNEPSWPLRLRVENGWLDTSHSTLSPVKRVQVPSQKFLPKYGH